MKPVDFRQETFESLKDRLRGQRMMALAAWQNHGPGTTRQVAERARLSILTFRPRTTELIQMGAVCLADQQESSAEGSYRARGDAEWADYIRTQRVFTTSQQQLL